MEQLKTIGRELAMSSQVGWGTSKEFLDIVKAIGEAKSKAEEERIVTGEIEILKKKIAEPDVPRKKMKEYIIRLVYVEMLGHDASFGYIHAVKMTHDDNLLLKKSGYLAVTLFLNEDHDLIILIVNTIQKDLRSDNYLVACTALTAVCKLINEETIPAVLPQVVQLLTHPRDLVKKKAVMALHRFYQRSPQTVAHLLPKIQEAVYDTDPSVISAALCALYDLITADPRPYKTMTAAFVNILKQVAEGRFPKPYEYRRTPAPFIQIKLLKILALLGAGDKSNSDNMYNVLADVLKKTDSVSNIGNAILYECICTITSIHPHAKLIADVAEITSRFLKENSHNLKYMGIDALGRIFKINPEFAEKHQLAVIDCLEDPDDTLKRKTLDLLYKMTRSTNVEVIVKCFISYIRTIHDAHNKTEIASRIIELAERFAPSNQWFIQTMNQVFELAGNLVPSKVAHDLMRLIAEGAGEEDEDADSQLRSSAVESYLRVLEEPKLPSILLQVICWVLGEYGTADGCHSAMDIIGKLCDVIDAHPGEDTIKGYAITAITKICAFEICAGRRVQLIPACRAVIEELSASHSTDLQQRAYELQTFLNLPADVVGSVMPLDGSCEDIEIDKNLSFLHGIVETALANGARPYIPEHERDAGVIGLLVTDESYNEPHPTALKFEAYDKPVVQVPASAIVSVHSSSILSELDDFGTDPRSSTASSAQNLSVAPDVDLITAESSRLKLDGVQRKWGRQTHSPSPASTSLSDKDRFSNGLIVSDRSHRYSKNGATSSSETIKPVVEVSSAKQKLAASLFGGGQTSAQDSSGDAAKLRRTAQKGDMRSRTNDSDISSLRTGPPAQIPLPAPADLVDLSDEQAAPVPASDPFQLLEGLVSPHRPSDPTNLADLAGQSDGNSASLYGIAQVSTAGPHSGDNGAAMLFSAGPSSDLLGLQVKPSVPMKGFPHIQPANAMAKKGPSPEGSLQKFATARQAGVIPSPNADMFKDLLS